MEKEIVQEQPQLNLPSRLMSNMRLDRVGRICFNMGVACGVLILVALLATIVMPLLQMLLIVGTFTVVVAMVIFTLGMVFVMPNSPIGKVWDFLGNLTNSSFAMDAVGVMITAIPYICFAGIISSIFSIIMLSISKQKGWVGKLVTICIFAVIMLVIIILHFVSGGALWQN